MSPLRTHLLALGAAMLLAALLTWPFAVDPAGGLIGHPGNDTWNHVWGFWWIDQGIWEDGGLPSRTPLLNHPYGGTLYFIDSFNAIWTSLLLGWMELPARYNLSIFFSMVCNAYGAWALCHHLLRDFVPAMIAAVVFACSPHLLGQAYNGITETLNMGWLPLYILSLMRLMERPTWGRAALTGFMLGVCALSNFYYGLFGGLISILLVGHLLLWDPRRLSWQRFIPRLGLSVVVFAAMVLPVLSHLSATMEAEDAMVNRDPEFVWSSLLRHNITDVVGFFRPGKHYSPDLKVLYGEELLIVTYLGWGVLILAGVGYLLHRRRRELGPWVLMITAFWLLSLGPYLHVAGEYVQIDGRRIPLPFLPFFKAFPLFSRISHPFRMVVPVTLGLAILVGHGARLLTQGMPSRLKLSAMAGMSVLLAGELLLASPAVWPLPRSAAQIPQAYTAMEGEPGSAVLDLPITVPNLERAIYTYYQTQHRLASPYGLNEPLPQPLQLNRLTRLLVDIESSYALYLPRVLPELELVSGVDLLRAQGYRYIVVHESLYPEFKLRSVETLLDALVGQPEKYPEEGIALYRL